MQRTTVTVVSPDPLAAPGISNLLSAYAEIEVVPVQAERPQVAIVVADGRHPSLLDLISAVSGAKIILLSDELSEPLLRAAIRGGVVAVLAPAALTGEGLSKEIQRARQQQPDAGLPGQLATQLERIRAGLLRPVDSDAPELAPRERELLRLLAKGCETDEIATQLAYSQRTVKNIVQGLLTRFRLRNRTHAVAFAVRAGLI